MPVLALHFGESKVYTLLVQDDFTFATMSFDYVYLPNVYASSVSEQQFYSEVVTLILKSYGVAKTSIEIIATGFPIVPTILTPYKLALPINELLSKFSDLSATAFFVINNFSFFANGNFASGFPYYSIDQEELFNLPMYNFCDEEFDKTFLNRLLHYHIANLAQATYRLPAPIKGQKSPVEATTLLFTGEQFSVHTRERRSMLMLLILDIMRSPGIYSLKVDDSNMLLLFGLLVTYDQKYSRLASDYVSKPMGTLLNSPGHTECLVESSVGTSQLIDLKENELFFLPVPINTKVKALVKNSNSTNEYMLDGGSAGLIIDTRNKNSGKPLSESYVIFKDYIRVVEEATLGI